MLVSGVVMAIVGWLIGRRKEKVQLGQQVANTTTIDIENTRRIIEIWKDLNHDLEKKVADQSKRIGFLEGTLREQAMEHISKINEITETYERKMKEVEELYKDKCKQCELNTS